MQGKGVLQFLVVAFTLACLYSLSFTFVANSIEKDAEEYANGDILLERAYLDSMSSQTVFNLLIADYTFAECREKKINLGLDLQGGMNVTMEISLKELIQVLSGGSKDPAFLEALNVAEKQLRSSQKDFITLFYENYKEANPNSALAPLFATRENQDRVNFNSSDEDVLDVLRTEAKGAIDRSFNILRTRIDKFGVTQPNIQLLEGSNRILIELPGVDDKDRVRKLLQGSAKLEFWETFEVYEVIPNLEEINKFLREEELANDSTSTDDAIASTDSAASDVLSLLDELNDGDSTSSDSLADINALQANNPLYSALYVPRFQNEQGQDEFRGPAIGWVDLKDTAKINKIFSRDEVKQYLPANLKLKWSVKPLSGTTVYELVALKSGRDDKAALEGDVISNARADFDQDGLPQVTMYMSNEGAKTWKRLTKEASSVDPKRSIAIVLDDAVYSHPTVQGEISGGISSISGGFTVPETQDMSNILKAGKLPAPAVIVEEQVVGPSLGKESIRSGLISAIAGLALVLVFMMFYYNQAGLVANIALVANIFFILGVLASLNAVLTLPGIAGIVLTIGMSVDANVLIYERIREELRRGKGKKLAIVDGYKNAYSSIIDANVTTLLTGIVLYLFGKGPILGFATTLIIGIITSLFAAVFITRLIFEWQLSREKDPKFSIPATENIMTKTNYDFMKKRKIPYAISSIVIGLGILSIVVRGFSLGVDFKGGRSYVMKFDEAVSVSDIRSSLSDEFGVQPEVKTFGTSNQVKITTSYMIDSDDENADNVVEEKLMAGLSDINSSGEILSSQKVGPTIANDIKIGAIYSVLFALLIIFAYLLIRFRKWQFGLGALTALAHDVLLVLSVFSIFNGILPFSLDIDQAFIAAILTVVGYSINDTVVVFDRVREFLGLHHTKSSKLGPVINDALNSTLSRTIITSTTTVFVLLVLFLFGGEVIRGFTFAMLLGVLVGTYSSLFIATPVVTDFLIREKEKKA
ncbi:MAG: SecD/SecF fusion protein [Sphingobacteriales bacterium]|jgi:SecD/SecF fusion protein